MNTQEEVAAYYAELETMKQRTPSAHDEAFAKALRQDDERPDTSMKGHAHTQRSEGV